LATISAFIESDCDTAIDVNDELGAGGVLGILGGLCSLAAGILLCWEDTRTSLLLSGVALVFCNLIVLVTSIFLTHIKTVNSFVCNC
jgi:hypothetical protein